jgi:DNA-binding HxlR family transcriptional regulator
LEYHRLVPDHRYPQFCPTARAAEILGERWTLLIARELLCGPQRFTDLRRRLPGISSSLLAERLGRLEERGLVVRREAPPPAPATLYELTELGGSLRPVLLELMRFGARFIDLPRPGDHLEPDWMRLALAAFARRSATPARRFAVRVPDTSVDVEIYVCGGRRGTSVTDGSGPAEVSFSAEPMQLLGLAAGGIDPDVALDSGQLVCEGDRDALRDFPALFDLSALLARPPEVNASNPTG